MNVDVLLKLKSCCFCLSLRTGCYMIATAYLLVSLLFFTEELVYAISMFKNHIERQTIGGLCFYDTNPTVTIIFTLCYIHGLRKHNKGLIFCGIPLVSLSLSINLFRLLVTLILWIVNHHNSVLSYLEDLLVCTAIEVVFVIIIYSYYNQVVRKNGPVDISSTEATHSDFHEAENPNFILLVTIERMQSSTVSIICWMDSILRDTTAMNIDIIFKPKSCCFCLSLRTGSYIIAILYLLVSLLLILAELTGAVFRFTHHISEKRLAVVFADDITPSVSALFAIFYIYGLCKQNKIFIFYGIPLVSISLATDTFSIVYILIRWAVGFKSLGLMFILDYLVIAVFESFFFVIVFNYYNQFDKLNKPAERLSNVQATHDFHEVENPNFEIS